MHTDAHGDIITVVTRKSEHQQGAWILTGDIRVRFPISRAAISAYEQQRAQHNNKDPKAERLLTYEGQVSSLSSHQVTIRRRRRTHHYTAYTHRVQRFEKKTEPDCSIS
jgi:hypothetical protein